MRLGVSGWKSVKNHAFFKDFDWQGLADKKMKSPLLNIINGNKLKFPKAG